MKQLPNTYSSYQLTEMEELVGSTFNPEQTYVLRNHLSQAALAKLNLVFDPSNPLEFTQQNAYQEGRISLLVHLLEVSDINSNTLANTQTPNPDSAQII